MAVERDERPLAAKEFIYGREAGRTLIGALEFIYGTIFSGLNENESKTGLVRLLGVKQTKNKN